MAKKIILFFMIITIFASCSKYYQFDEYYSQGQYLKAYEVLDEIKNKESEEFYLREFQVVTRIALGGDSDFINKLEMMVTNTYPKKVDSYAHFAKTFLLFQEATEHECYETVISNLTKSSMVPDEFHGETLQISGIAKYKIGNYVEAIKDLEKSHNLTGHIDNHYFIGLCYDGLDMQKKAVASFDMVISSSKNELLLSQSFFQKGEIYYSMNQFDDALQQYIKAINNYSHSANFNFKLGKCLQRLGYKNLAPKFFKVSLRIDKNFADAWYQLNIN